MNILAVVEEFPGASDVFVVEQGSALVHAGYHVTVAAGKRGNTQTIYRQDATPRANLTVRSLAPLDSSGVRPLATMLARAVIAIARSMVRSPFGTWRFARRCRAGGRSALRSNLLKYTQFLAFPADVVHFESPAMAARYPKLGSLLGLPSVVTFRANDVRALEVASDHKRQATIEQLRDVRAIQCASNGLARRTHDALSATSDKIRIVRPGVAIARESVDASPAELPVIAMIAPLRYPAGLEYLLLALARLRDDGIAFEARIAGGGPLRAYGKYTASVLGLSENVKWLGPLTTDSMADLLDTAQIYVTSALEEDVTRHSVQAMAHGLAMVTADVFGCGYTELVRDGDNGFVVPSRDVAALADRLRRLIVDPSESRAMGRSARERVAAEFSIESQNRQIDELYAKVRA
ncbi:MAG TPA: glycosyltransferase family 4 protein [Ilumatobacter sp.]|nr:glycosyltransferase family 4 protein [Ilumatobacter sp.]